MSSERVRRWIDDPRLARVVESLALLPVIAIVIEVTKAPRLQLLDYWSVLLRITDAVGDLYPAGLRYLQNEHPLMLPSLFYWLDAALFAGDNRVLGYLAIALGIATVLLLRAALPQRLPVVVRACLVVTGAALVFSLHGLHNYALGMSGTAWLLANLIVIVALLLGLRGQWQLAWLAGLLACMSYGTAFVVWPALALLATMRGERWWKRLVPLGIGVCVVIVWLLLRPEVRPGDAPATDAGQLFVTWLTVIGHLWTANNVGIAVAAGAVILLGYGAMLAVPAARARPLWFWWALALHAVLASAMIAAARIDFGTGFGLSSRYTSLSVLASVPLLVIIASVTFVRFRRAAPRIAIAALAAGVLGFMLGSPTAATVRAALFETPLQAVAIRIGLGDGLDVGLPRSEVLTPRLEAMGHYPFTDDFTLGCAGPELGTKLDLAKMSPLPAVERRKKDQPAGWVDSAKADTKGAVVRGWATGAGPADPVRCVLVTSASGEVTGGGQYHLPRLDVARTLTWVGTHAGFAVIAPADENGRVVVILESGKMLWLPARPPAEN